MLTLKLGFFTECIIFVCFLFRCMGLVKKKIGLNAQKIDYIKRDRVYRRNNVQKNNCFFKGDFFSYLSKKKKSFGNDGGIFSMLFSFLYSV